MTTWWPKSPSHPFLGFVARDHLKRARLAVALLVIAQPSFAQQSPVRLTLEDAQARAVESSHRLAEARAREAVVLAGVDARAAAQRPIVSALAGYTRTNHVTEFVVPSASGPPRVLYPDAPDNYRTRLDLQWPIYTGGRADALERAARAEAAAASAEIDVRRADLRLEVARSFWALVTARATVAVLEQGVARAQAHVVDVRERLNAGLSPPNEVASAEAQESRQRMLLIEARSQEAIVAADLARLVFDDPDRAIEPAAALEGAAAPRADLNAAATLAVAREQRRERDILERQMDAAAAQRLAAEAGRKPVVSVTGGVDYARPNPRIFPRAEAWDDSWDAGVNVSWPMWDGGRAGAEIAHAAGTADAARRRLAEFDSTLAVDVRQRVLEIESGMAAIAAADDAIRAAAEARRVVTERFRAGVIAQIEVLDADFALLQAELDRTRALAGVRLAEARLARATGQ
jgi:outer membrane protein TolC